MWDVCDMGGMGERALTLRNEYTNPIAIASVLYPSLRYEKASMQQGYLPRGHVFFGRTTGHPRKKWRRKTGLCWSQRENIRLARSRKLGHKLQERIEGVMWTSFKFNLVPCACWQYPCQLCSHLSTKAYSKKIINSL